MARKATPRTGASEAAPIASGSFSSRPFIFYLHVGASRASTDLVADMNTRPNPAELAKHVARFPSLKKALLLPSAAVAYENGELPERTMKRLQDLGLWVLRNGSDGHGYYETKLGFDVSGELRKLSKSVACNCDAQVQRHRVTTVQRIALHETGGCSRKGTTTMRHAKGGEFKFCAAHARMAREGFIESDGSVMAASDRSNYQTGRCKGNPYDFGKWSEVK